MHSLKKYLACAALGCAAFVHGEDAVLSDTQAARLANNEAARLYNEAVSANRTALAVFSTARARLAELNGTLQSQKYTFEDTARARDGLDRRAKLLKAQFTRNQDRLATAKTNADALRAVLPLAATRMQTATAQASEFLETARKSPGDRYQDLNYATQVVARMTAAAEQLDRAQNEAQKIAVTLAVAVPRIEGVRQTLALFEDFHKKSADAIQANARRLEAAEKKLTERLDAALAADAALAKDAESLNAARVELLRASVGLQAFILNTLAENKTYANAVFPPLNLADALAQATTANVYRAKTLAPVGKPLHLGAMGFDSNLAEDKAAQIPVAEASAPALAARGAKLDTPKTVREEILERARDLIALTAELEHTRQLVQSVVDDAATAMRAIERDEADAKKLLAEGMENFTRAQTLGADLEIFAGTLAVAKAQDDVSASELEKLAAQVQSRLAASAEKRAQCDKALASARAALKP